MLALFDVVLILIPLLLLLALILLIALDNQTKHYLNIKDLQCYDVYKLKRPIEIKEYTLTRIAYDENNEVSFISDKTFSKDYIKVKGYKND